MCPNACPVKMEERRVERLYHKDNKRIIIKGLVIMVCPECGQEVIPLSSMKRIDVIIKGKVPVNEIVETPIYEMV